MGMSVFALLPYTIFIGLGVYAYISMADICSVDGGLSIVDFCVMWGVGVLIHFAVRYLVHFIVCRISQS